MNQPSLSRRLFVSPHCDDEVLFGAFVIQQQKPQVVIVFDSHVQAQRGHERCSVAARRRETLNGLACLGIPESCVHFLGFNDAEPIDDATENRLTGILAALPADEVWIPAVEDGGHEQHNLVGRAGLRAFPAARRYLTYTRTAGKSTGGNAVPVTGEQVLRKLKALACHRTQLEIDALGCWPHFLRDQTEYCL